MTNLFNEFSNFYPEISFDQFIETSMTFPYNFPIKIARHPQQRNTSNLFSLVYDKSSNDSTSSKHSRAKFSNYAILNNTPTICRFVDRIRNHSLVTFETEVKFIAIRDVINKSVSTHRWSIESAWLTSRQIKG